MAGRPITTLVLAAALGLIPALVSAGPNASARFLVRLKTPVAKNVCGLRATPPVCTGVQTAGQIGSGYFAYVIIDQVSAAVGVGADVLAGGVAVTWPSRPPGG